MNPGDSAYRLYGADHGSGHVDAGALPLAGLTFTGLTPTCLGIACSPGSRTAAVTARVPGM
jgi:hypothetical protein